MKRRHAIKSFLAGVFAPFVPVVAESSFEDEIAKEIKGIREAKGYPVNVRYIAGEALQIGDMVYMKEGKCFKIRLPI